MGNRIKNRATKAPKELRRAIEMSMEISNRIFILLDQQNKTQKDLADLLGKSESEISKWLSGTHNFTLKTLSKIESVLGGKICNFSPTYEMRSVGIISETNQFISENLEVTNDSKGISVEEQLHFQVLSAYNQKSSTFCSIN